MSLKEKEDSVWQCTKHNNLRCSSR